MLQTKAAGAQLCIADFLTVGFLTCYPLSINMDKAAHTKPEILYDMMEWAKASNIRKRCFLCIKSIHAKACYWCSGPYILDLHLGWKGRVKKKKKVLDRHNSKY